MQVGWEGKSKVIQMKLRVNETTNLQEYMFKVFEERFIYMLLNSTKSVMWWYSILHKIVQIPYYYLFTLNKVRDD